MASYHLSVKTVSRSTGRSGPGAAAYRTASLIECERDGTVHDYRGRRGVETAFVVVPEGAEWALDRAVLWNAAEAAEKRKDAKVAREYELALPCELDAHERAGLALEFATAVVSRFGVAADVAIHAPGREGDHRNWHAHVLTTTRVVEAEGLGAKTRELDVAQTAGPAVEALRELWAVQVNQALERIQAEARVDHRSFARRGLDREAEQHLGVAASGMERKGARQQAQARERVALASALEDAVTAAVPAPVPTAPERGEEPVRRPGEATEVIAGVKEQSVATMVTTEVSLAVQDWLPEVARAVPAHLEAPEPAQGRQALQVAQEGLELPRAAQERVSAVWPVSPKGPELDPTVRPSAGVFGAGAEPVTRIGQRNAEIQERNRALEAAKRALEAAQRVLEGLERAARRVLDLARGLGTQAAAEREARVQEAKRQRQERERAAAERRAELERQERARVEITQAQQDAARTRTPALTPEAQERQKARQVEAPRQSRGMSMG